MMMRDAQPGNIYLKDYSAPRYLIDKTALRVDIRQDDTVVLATLDVRRNPDANDRETSLVLDGQGLSLQSLSIDGKPLTPEQFSATADELLIHNVPEQFTLTSEVIIRPKENSSLEGNPLAYETLENGRHRARWHDPFPKPAYLFALVAGELSVVEDNFTTCSGRNVVLQLYVESKDLEKCDHAMTSLKNAMRWDEEVYGREYDLDLYMIVAVDDFNMGAMENKGLNIFNTSCVLAHQATTTDDGFNRVEAVVAHEYFHNWSGNRVTCRDWFQLSLKEGFTVFRDSQFSADMGSPVVKRVENVTMLRTVQFAEDGGPTAHPVQPASYMEISKIGRAHV